MKKILTIVLCAFTLIIHAQDDTSSYTAPHFVKKPVSTSGCYAYFPDDVEMEFDLEYSPDSSEVFTGDFYSGGFHYAIIVIKLNNVEMADSEEKETMIISYLDYLQGTFNIVASAGYGKGHTHIVNTNATGIIDYWEDDEADQWAVKAWADGSTLAVMMIYGPTEYPNFNVQQVYLNGFRFY